MNRLFLSHNIFLTDKEKKDLTSPGSIIKVTGISIPVWRVKNLTSEPANEIFCNYAIGNIGDRIKVRYVKDGYVINIPLNKCIELEQKSRMIFSHHGKMIKDKKQCSVISYITIQNFDLLEESIKNSNFVDLT